MPVFDEKRLLFTVKLYPQFRKTLTRAARVVAARRIRAAAVRLDVDLADERGWALVCRDANR